MSYGNCLTVGANAIGLYLGVLFLFRVAHPPLFVPWSEVGVVERKGLFSNFLEFSFQQAPGVTLRLPRMVGVLLIQAGGRDPGTLREITA